MTNIKTAFSFSKGTIGETEKFNFVFPEDIPTVSTIEGVKSALSPTIVQNKISGKVSIEITDEKLYVTYNVQPKEFVSTLEKELARLYAVSYKNP